MKSNSISLEDELKTQDQRCKLLLTGEWISLVLSGVGTVVTALGQNAVFAATPLTCSLFLNILSRSYQDKRIYDQSNQNLIEVQRQSTSKIQGIRSEFLGMDFSENGMEGVQTKGDFAELALKVKQLESFLEIQGGDYYSQSGAVNQEVSILRNHQLEMAEAIESLTTQMGGSVNNVDQTDILDHLDRLSAAVYELEQKTAAIAPNENADDQGMNTLLGLNHSPEFSSQIESIQSQMTAIEERMNFMATADPAYDPDLLQNDMVSLIHPLQSQIADLEAQVQEQQAQLNMSSEPPSNDSQVDAVNENIAALQVKLENALTQISTDVTHFQTSLQTTHEQMGDIQERMNSLQSLANETAEINRPELIQQQMDTLNAPLKEQLNSIQLKIEEFGQLQGQLDHVQSLAQQSVEQSHPEMIQAKVSAATAPLLEQVVAVEEKVKVQAPNQDIMTKLQQVIEPLQSHIVALEQRINQISSEGDRTPLLNKIAALQGQVQNVESRFASIPSNVPDHSGQLNQLTAKIADMQAQIETVSTQVSQDLQEMPKLIEKNVEEKETLLSELQSLSFEEKMSGKKSEASSELDDLLNSLI